ncbi:hybrid sensor histidine kinase/response regulator transcription factor [uncultured Chitinophaga sp.]|uniref:hybrid sensor histidine kinase/response regulator transcription factor n=1 Tax=uncultured Chitinophaga sp. TaxID=339340 RepID=UPI0025EAEBA3|nr:hybrid sensor histidine kinase/response regulator transcription factor [uncultured Chitinophaga sp.]
MILCRQIILVFLACLSSGIARAQHRDFHFVNFGSKDGLSSNTVNVILKDHFGYMWFGTDDGLSRFDGSRFTIYTHNAADTTTIRSNTVLALLEDERGNLWIGTHKGLSLYDRSRNTFRSINVTGGNSVRALCTDHNGYLWVGSYSGLYRYHPRTGAVKYYTAGDGKSHLASSMVLSLLEDGEQRLWVGSNGGLHLYQQATDDFRLFKGRAPDSLLTDITIRVISEDRHGDIWVGTIDGGLHRLPRGGTGFRRYRSEPGPAPVLSSNRIFDIAHDVDGKIWIGTEKGLNILDPEKNEVRQVTANARNAYSLKGNSIRSIYIDKNGIYWLGTFQSGVNKYDKNLTAFHLVQSNPFDPTGLSAPKVTSFAEAEKGKMYVGTDGGGLNLYNPDNGLFARLTVGRDPLTILAMERAGNDLWLATYLQGIYVLNMVSGKVKHYYKDDGISGLNSDEIFCIRKDRRNNLWIGTNGKGVLVYSAATEKFVTLEDYTAGASGDKALPKGFIRAIEEDKDGKIWMAVPGRGIEMYDPVTNTFRLFGPAQTQLPVDEVLCLLVGENNVLWAGTGGRGICRLDFNRDSFKLYAARDGLANDVVWKILEDSTGKLWLSTNKGLSLFDPQQPGFKNFTHENGLQQSAFTLGAGLRTTNGQLFFGGLDGFNYFSPASLQFNHNVPAVIFTGLKVDNINVTPGSRQPVKEDIAYAKEIRLNYKQNFSIDFTVLDYTSPNDCNYSYQLEGFDKGWNNIGANKTAVFTNLDPGEYTLLVKAHSPNGGWTTGAASMAVYIKPPFWRTGYAYAFYIVAILLLLWGLRYRGIMKLKRKFSEEQERQQIRQLIEEERKEAERQRVFDNVKIKFLTNLSHEFRTPISLIAGPVQTLLDDEADSRKKEQLSMVKRNTRRLLNLVNQLLDFRKLEEQELRLDATPGDIAAFVNEVVESFKDLAERRHIKFSFQCYLDNYYTLFDRDKVERILFNLLSNAFKFTGRDGNVGMELRADPGDDSVLIIIQDNGIGMSEEEQRRIFDRFFQVENPPGIMNQGSGIGLSITHEFVKLHGGSIDVASVYGSGSRFTVSLPLIRLEQAAVSTQSGGVILQEPSVPADDLAVARPDTGEYLTVLIIEDNEDFRSYLKNYLKPYYKVMEAADGREGWQKALSAHPHVIVSDISMPYMDGITLSKKIRADKRTAHIPIILLTALTGDAYHLKGLQTGASDYLTKPFSAEILKVKIQNLALLNQSFKETYSRRLQVVTQPAAMESENEKLLLRITGYIEDNIDDEKLSVEQLAKYLFISRATLYNKVVDITGETPVEFIRSVRLNRAAVLLEKSDLRIAEIGYSVGFLTPNYFARAFKMKFNMSPSEYAAMKKSAS